MKKRVLIDLLTDLGSRLGVPGLCVDDDDDEVERFREELFETLDADASRVVNATTDINLIAGGHRTAGRRQHRAERAVDSPRH